MGEAGCSPPSHSLISDVFQPHERATAIGVYTVGVNIGILLGFLIGGWINEFFGWRMAFFAVGVPGILLAVVIRFTVREPTQVVAADRSESIPSLGEAFRCLWVLHTFRYMALAAAFIAFAGYGLLNWLPSFFIRIHGLGTGTVGTWFALILGLCGGIATWMVGYLADRLGKRDVRWYLWITALSIALYMPLLISIFLVENAKLALVLYIIPGAFITTYLAPIIAVTHSLVPNRMRALSSAIVYLVLNLIGLGLGPVTVGFISDLLAPARGTESLRYAIMVTVPAAAFLGALFLMLGARHIRAELPDS